MTRRRKERRIKRSRLHSLDTEPLHQGVDKQTNGPQHLHTEELSKMITWVLKRVVSEGQRGPMTIGGRDIGTEPFPPAPAIISSFSFTFHPSRLCLTHIFTHVRSEAHQLLLRQRLHVRQQVLGKRAQATTGNHRQPATVNSKGHDNNQPTNQ